LYFVDAHAETFKTTVLHRPYFYLLTHKEDGGLGQHLLKKYSGFLVDAQLVPMLDLDQPNHLSPNSSNRKVWKLLFDNVSHLMEVRTRLREVIKSYSHSATNEFSLTDSFSSEQDKFADPWKNLEELREYDVPYVVRVCMDLEIRAGSWFTVTVDQEDGGAPQPTLSDPDIETKANPRVLAFDIECSKAPLKFPNAEMDEIYMISYMVSDGRGTPEGFLICSRSVVSQDVLDFEYTPKPSYPGPFSIFNELNEQELIMRFIREYQRLRPQIVVTYNGDHFDWPYLAQRAEHHGIDLWNELGIFLSGDDEIRGRCCVHLDAFRWVQRDSYLPQGSQGLKAVTKYKLGYDPVEVDPEDMLPMAQERPVHMATYSVSDAVATYYLYEKYVHLFIFSLCTLIPMGPEDVLRKGSGTLCEALLMVQANALDIVCPNKQIDPLAKFHQGHLLESETYIGGKVECLETGVYRSDVEYEFDLKPTAFQQLIDNIDRDLCFSIEVEGGMDRSDITNYDEVRSQIVEQLENLRDRPKRVEKPYIYHLDVGAMYPNIILTNRLQPSAIVDDATCAACDFNQVKNGCKRKMDWVWRGDYSPAGKLEYDRTKDQLSREVMKDGQRFIDMPERDQAAMVITRLKEYSRNAYRRTKVTEEITKENIVCMRENDFYVDTVRRFRDRRYDYKKMTNTWKKKIGAAKDAASKKEAEDKALVYDSLQVAHKCILNSFYGYVMRKGARWRSMEMAGIVTKTGADLITQARVLVEQIGRPLELDTDGIWCILPKSFPDVYTFKTQDGSKMKLEYPCIMLNADVHDNFTNHQYQTLKDPKRGTYESRSECSIFFEVDGPYRCMVLPASTEEGKLLKKRYAVFNFDGSLAELKGFELKRRGELELIKTFQSQVFERFLDGNSLSECYDSVAEIANHWIDVIDTRGESLEDDELVDLISENRNMSRQLDDYGDQKGTSQTTARRLGEFLGAEIIKDKGLNCKFIIAEQPYGAPVTERAIPTAIWKAEPAVTKHFLRRWLKAPGLEGDGFGIRNILDWDYYLERLGKTIQKIITIPAALQKVPNPVPRVAHPAWLDSKVQQLNDPFQQRSIRDMFSVKKSNKTTMSLETSPMDIEDIAGQSGKVARRPVVHSIKRRGKRADDEEKKIHASEDLPRADLTDGNFDDWLKQKKSLWRKNRRDRRMPNLRGSGGESLSQGVVTKTRKSASSMEGFVREAALNLSEREWQIVEIREMTSYDTGRKHSHVSSGEFVVWVMIGSDSLRKMNITVPRTVYVSTKEEIRNDSSDILELKKVDKHLPHSKRAAFLYEISMPEFVYRNKHWTANLKSVQSGERDESLLIEIFETGTPLMMRALTELGCVSKVTRSAPRQGKSKKSHLLSELQRVDQPNEGLYLNKNLSYKRCFLYTRVNPRTKTGLVAFFALRGGSGSHEGENGEGDVTAPSKSAPGTYDMSATCKLWIVKPGSSRGQKNLALKHCEGIFSQLLETIQGAVDLESEYACVSPQSICKMSSLSFVDRESLALSQANDALNTYLKSNNGPTFLLVNSSKPTVQLRGSIPMMNSLPVVYLPFPPGPEHNPSISTLPALNWEQPAVQLCLEAYFYMGIISFPKRVSYSRYGNLPVGNLGEEENYTLYDVGLARMLKKNRAVSWAAQLLGRPDLGGSFSPSSEGSVRPSIQMTGMHSLNHDDLWGDDEEIVSPVVRRPGCFRSTCVDIDLQDLAIAALTDTSSFSPSPQSNNPASPTSVLQLDANQNSLKSSEPLGDEMSTSTCLPILRALVSTWLRDAFSSNNEVADSLLHHVYRVVSAPETLMHDPALHRVVHALMKSTFTRLLGELQRLGCCIVFASFHKITVATNKTNLEDAVEYINFVVNTIRGQMGGTGETVSSLSRVALRPRQFHTQFLFLDEYNFGTMHLEVLEKNDANVPFYIDEDKENNTIVVPSVVTAWSIMNYLGSETAQEYFRILVGRFSKDALKKQVELKLRDGENDAPSVLCDEHNDELVSYKKKMVSKHFSAYLTRAVAEIIKDHESSETGESSRDHLHPVLQFIKSIMVVLELDHDVDTEVHVLKRSLLAQIGVAEYSNLAKWENPCKTFILPDVFCMECHESRDINLCYIPPPTEEGVKQVCWINS
jgi:DNA polymerase epsilon subunit 1